MDNIIRRPTASQRLAGLSNNQMLTPTMQQLGQVKGTVRLIMTTATSPTTCVHAHMRMPAQPN
jgi:hypothetical protein